MVGMTALQETAADIERSLADKKTNITSEQIAALEFELNIAFKELSKLTNISISELRKSETFDAKKAEDIFAELEPLLKSDSFDCLNLVDELSTIPGTELLIEQVENFNFKQAMETLAKIKDKLKCDNGK